MLKLPNLIGDAEARKILKKFVNDRLIDMMETIILDEVAWRMAVKGELDESAANKSFDEMVDFAELMIDMDFAQDVSSLYLPENYPIERANQVFFGLYKLLKAKKEYVPELVMEYALNSVIQRQINEVDLINEEMEDGIFDDMEEDEGFWDADAFANIDDEALPFYDEDHPRDFTDPFIYDDVDISDLEDDEDDEEEYSTVMPIPEPDRTTVKKAILEDMAGDYEGEELEEVTEDIINMYEDLRRYEESCFWDVDFLLLDKVTEEQLRNSPANEYFGIIDPKEPNVVEFPFRDEDGKQINIQANIDINPWDMEDDEDK
ncbi:hypothetical protein [Butyrivibrio sp. INlla14]|uniref:hypothetical protein n=1 Tax=Butyrivibrio sp. INlla14 TaxID=1520808 RepID=UPI000877391B|nr:hypothetical protein [Butyrivibrio sp. INlla14]SCY14435.1 hypothetical protein SAMN02910371_01206 [Butyrivibrio sp. INlla14]